MSGRQQVIDSHMLPELEEAEAHMVYGSTNSSFFYVAFLHRKQPVHFLVQPSGRFAFFRQRPYVGGTLRKNFGHELCLKTFPRLSKLTGDLCFG